MKRWDIMCDCDGGQIDGDVALLEAKDGYWMKADDVLKFLEEIAAANKSAFSKYEVNQIVRREGVQSPLQTNW